MRLTGRVGSRLRDGSNGDVTEVVESAAVKVVLHVVTEAGKAMIRIYFFNNRKMILPA